MRKMIAFFLSVFILLSFGFLVLDSSFNALADWLGPLLGSHIYTFFTVIYLLFTDPFRHFLVSIVWIFVGFLTGVVSGKKIGAGLTALSVWSSTFFVLCASFYGMYLSLDARGIFIQESLQALRIIPIIPSHLDFDGLLRVPVFSGLFFRFVEMIPTINESFNPRGIIMTLLTPFMISLFSKPVIIVLSALAGATVSESLIESAMQLWSSRNKIMALIPLLILVSSFSTPILGLNTDNGVYFELLEAYTDGQGRVLSGGVIVGSEVQSIPLNLPEADGLVAWLIFTQRIYDPRVLYTLPIENVADFIHFMNLFPSTFAVTVYVGEDVQATGEKSSMIMNQIQRIYDIEFQEIISVPLIQEEKDENTLPPMIASLYYSQKTLEEAMQGITSGFIEERGFIDSIQEKIGKGTHKDLEIYTTGLIQTEFLEDLLLQRIPQEYIEFTDPLFRPYSFIGGFQLSDKGVQQIGSNYVLDLMNVLDIDLTPKYAQNSDGSFIILAYSNQTGLVDSPTIHILTSMPEESSELKLVGSFLEGLGPTEILSKAPTTADIQLVIPGIHVPDLTITKTSRDIKREKSEITLSVKNNGVKTFRNLKLEDSFPLKYGVLLSGTGSSTWSQLQPGESNTLVYEVKLNNPGSYTDVPAILSFEMDGNTYWTASDTLETVEKNVNPLTLMFDNVKAITSLLDLVSNNRGNLVALAIVAIILIITANDLR